MSASRNRQASGFFNFAVITLWVVLIVVGSFKAVNAEGPISLSPAVIESQSTSLEENAETTVTENEVTPEKEKVEQTGDPTLVDVIPLEKVDPNSVGLLHEETGGFGIGMWKGTNRNLLERLLPKLPVTARSPTMQALQRRLLLSTATAPSNSDLQTNLLPLRLERLAAMGASKAVIELVRIIPSHAMDESMTIIHIESIFLTGATETACKEVRKQIHEYQGAHWQRMLIFCEAIAKEVQAVQLGLALLSEMPGKSTPAFFQLVDAILGKDDVHVFNLPDPAPLEVVMIREAGRQVPPDAGTTTSPAILRALAMNPNAPIALRLNAGERAEAMGTLTPDELGHLYRSVSFRSEEIRDAKNTTPDGARGRVLLYRAARERTDSSVRAELLQRLWKEAMATDASGATYATAVRVNLPTLLAITPDPNLAWFAVDAGKALLLADQPEQAFAWLTVVQQIAYGNANAEAMRDQLWPFVKLADGGGSFTWEAERLAAWWRSVGDTMEQKQEAELLFGLLAAMGEPVGAAQWVKALGDAPRTTAVVPALAIWHGLAEAASEARIGETVLLALLSLGEAGPGEAAPIILEAAIIALKQVGLEQEARRLALEASLMKGL